MRKLLFILILGLIAFGINACKPGKPCPPKEKKVQLFIGILDDLEPSPFTYKAMFNDFTGVYEITPSTVFNLTYPEGTTNDSIAIKVFAEHTDGTIYDMIWYKEGLDFSQASCKDGILYKTEILTNPVPAGAPTGIPPGSTTPVPIGTTNPPRPTNIP